MAGIRRGAERTKGPIPTVVIVRGPEGQVLKRAEYSSKKSAGDFASEEQAFIEAHKDVRRTIEKRPLRQGGRKRRNRSGRYR